jgi:lipopolysaccharide transport system ATP-binding protein
MCNRVIYLRSGKIEYDGAIDAGIEMYERGAHLSVVPWAKGNPEEWPVVLTDIELLGENDAAKTVFDFGEKMTVRLRYDAREPIESPNFIVAFVRSDGVGCTVFTNEADRVNFEGISGKGTVELNTGQIKLTAEKYVVHVLVRQQHANGGEKLLCAQVGRTFHVRHELLNSRFGVFHESASWRLEPEQEADAGTTTRVVSELRRAMTGS